MIIPVRCFTCGKVIGNKWLTYLEQVRKRKTNQGVDPNRVEYLTETNIRKTHEGLVMDELGIDKMCCRRHFLTHVDIE